MPADETSNPTQSDEDLTPSELSRALLQLTPDNVFVIDREMRVVLINPAAEHFLGMSSQEARGRHVVDLFGPLGARFE
jgi:PAS domain S-box-containing protein